MSLWIDFLGAEIRFVDTPTFGRVRLAEAGRGNPATLIFLHGIGGHLEAYAKNIVALSDAYHVVAFDFVGHGLSSKHLPEFSPQILAEQLRELLDVLGVESAHLSGESLGGWVAGEFATRYPDRVRRLMFNTSAGIPIVSAKGQEDLKTLIALSAKNAHAAPTYESVLERMQWLMHEKNWPLLSEDLVGTRLALYRLPERAQALPAIGRFMGSPAAQRLIDLEKIECQTLFLWTRDNPIHDVEAAQAACARVRHGLLYVMEADSAHWPQYEAPDEFNAVARRFFATGAV